MKLLRTPIFYFVILLGWIGCYSGKTIKSSILHGGISRDFSIYVPKKYTGSKPVPLLINLHGYTSNADEQMWYGDFRSISDTANIILVHPQGTKYHDTTHWNTGGWTPGSTVDDLGFLDSMIDYMSSNYNIDPKRIYAAGMSNGGEMSYHLACRLSTKIAAIASVSGAMTPETFRDCNPTRPVPVMHIHGTDDHVVPYEGDPTATSIVKGLNYWAKHNACDSIPIITHLPDINTQDSTTVDHYLYRGTADVEHFKILGGDHAWPGAKFKFRGTNYDINASAEIWKFLNRYDLDGLRR
jgi:polyhydroxybutyrate depolymerase